MAEGFITRRGVTTGAQPLGTTGGTITEITDGGVDYRVHTFTSSGTFEVTAGEGEVEYLVVAGGGSGGVDVGAGAGAGGLLTGTAQVSPSSNTVTVGLGGPKRPGGADDGPGSDGEDSSFLGVIALGGSGGTGWSDTALPSGNSNYSGGSGAGQSASSTQVNSVGVGTGTAGQGNDGGAAIIRYAGGGGGAVAAGQTGSDVTGGTGGLGFTTTIDGSTKYYAGGGTGGWDVSGGSSISGSPGSNNGVAKVGNSQSPEAACLPNTGHGGHGSNTNNEDSGAGGSGIVIIRYVI